MAQTEEERKAKKREYNRKWYAANRDKAAAACRRYYADHRAELSESRRRLRAKAGDVMRERDRHSKRSRYDPQRYRARVLRSRFQMTLDAYAAMHDEQGGLCAICEQPETRAVGGTPLALSVDHCHISGKVRGLLCSSCNTSLGFMKDNPSTLRKAASYLERHTP